MTCDQCGELMMDVLYGEDVQPRQAFEFFSHLKDCTRCEQDYVELVETRELLSEWSVEEAQGPLVDFNSSSPVTGYWKSVEWGTLLQRVAAGFLILMGAVAVLQSSGLIARPEAGVSESQLTEMIHDVVLARQVEDWKVIGAALLELKEEMEAQDRLHMKSVYEDLYSLENRYIEVMEENNRHIQTMLSR
jgi:hypothetical protein